MDSSIQIHATAIEKGRDEAQTLKAERYQASGTADAVKAHLK